MKIAIDDLTGDGVVTLLEEHLADMYANSPPESVHALDVSALKHASITFWCASEDGEALGCIALKDLGEKHGEIKSMRTTARARNKGVGAALLAHLLKEAKRRGFEQLSLETGSMDFFKPAHRLYEKYGFTECGPFSDYQLDPLSKFMTLNL